MADGDGVGVCDRDTPGCGIGSVAVLVARGDVEPAALKEDVHDGLFSLRDGEAVCDRVGNDARVMLALCVTLGVWVDEAVGVGVGNDARVMLALCVTLGVWVDEEETDWLGSCSVTVCDGVAVALALWVPLGAWVDEADID